MEAQNENLKSSHLHEIAKFINDTFNGYEGIKSDAAKIMLYRLVELALANQSEKCMADCYGMSILFDTNAVQIMMPIESIISPLEEIEKASTELLDVFLKIDDNQYHYCYRLFDAVSICKEKPSFLAFRTNGTVWRGICNFATCFGMDYITHKDVLYSIELNPEQKEQFLFIRSTLYQILDGDNSDQYMIAVRKIAHSGELESFYFKLKYYETEVRQGKMPREKMANTIIKILREDFQIYFKPSNKYM